MAWAVSVTAYQEFIMFTLFLLAINVATLVSGASGEKIPGASDEPDFIPCC